MIKRMLLREVEYARPESVEEAVRLLGAHDGARALAGGQTLVNVMKARAASPEVLVDLADLSELRAIGRAADGSLELGAMVTYSQLVGSPEVAAARPVLAEVAATIADRQVQNRGTVGGNVCVNDPTNHLPPLFAAMDATFTIVGPGGERTVSVDDFFLGVYMTAVGEGELLTRVTVPALAAGSGDAMEGITLGVHGTYLVSAAATVGPAGVRVAHRLRRRRARARDRARGAAARRRADAGGGARRRRRPRRLARSARRRARAGRLPPAARRGVLRARRAGRRRASEGMMQ